MMEKIKLLILTFGFFVFTQQSDSYAQSCPSSFYQITARLASGENVEMSQYKGAVVLVVNTASLCGFTPQYKELEELFEKYQSQKFVVLAFPSNDFQGQEPDSNQKIVEFCREKYGVRFPIFEKLPVTGEQKQLIYRYLTEQSGDEFSGEILWNFEKFLIDRRGIIRSRYGSITNPLSERLTNKLEELLAEDE